MPEPTTLLTGLAIGESPRWHDGRLWLCNWGTQEIVAVDAAGAREVMARVPTTLPFSIDWLPDGRLLVVSGPESVLLRQEPDGSLVTHADLSRARDACSTRSSSTAAGNAYVNGGGFNPIAGEESAPGVVVLVTPDGTVPAGGRRHRVRQRHGGHARTTRTLIVAESYGQPADRVRHRAPTAALSNRRVWADSATATRTASASTPRARSGTPTCRTGAACGCARAARCWTRSRSTAAASPACWAVPTAGRCSSWPRRGRAWTNMDATERTGVLLSTRAPAPGAGWPARTDRAGLTRADLTRGSEVDARRP